MGKLNFRGYLILRFYPTREIREILMHAKNMFYSIQCLLLHLYVVSKKAYFVFTHKFDICQPIFIIFDGRTRYTIGNLHKDCVW